MNSIYYKEGLNRNQQLLLPPSLNDYINEDNAVRAIGVGVGSVKVFFWQYY